MVQKKGKNIILFIINKLVSKKPTHSYHGGGGAGKRHLMQCYISKEHSSFALIRVIRTYPTSGRFIFSSFLYLLCVPNLTLLSSPLTLSSDGLCSLIDYPPFLYANIANCSCFIIRLYALY